MTKWLSIVTHTRTSSTGDVSLADAATFLIVFQIKCLSFEIVKLAKHFPILLTVSVIAMSACTLRTFSVVIGAIEALLGSSLCNGKRVSL